MTSSGPAIVWFRQDLRLADNAALQAAVARGGPVLPLYILDEDTPGRWAWGGASRWWLHHSLASLRADLRAAGADLLLCRGPADAVLESVIAQSGAGAVYWNRRYDPAGMALDSRLKPALRAAGLEARSFEGALLHEPWTLRTGGGEPYKVFTPFWKALTAAGDPPPPLPAPGRLEAAAMPPGDALDDWGLLPQAPDWSGGLRESWSVGESAARDRLDDFLEEALADYAEARDRPDRPGTSRLSPHLHWGEIGPRQVWHWTRERVLAEGGAAETPAWAFLRELAWREFCHHLLVHFPDLPEQPWRPGFADFPWAEDEAGYRAWTRGRTGYPIVDAGMRELWHCGWMHNRVRMIAASFLVKDLLVPWQRGEAWFWDTLVDADLANNAASWQWVAGSGADAAPYFRIFNPVRQGERFDPEGRYVRRWLPELTALPDRFIHSPWTAPPSVLAQAGLRLGQDYPEPLVDHAAARARALKACARMKEAPAPRTRPSAAVS